MAEKKVTRQEDYATWYNDLVYKADLAEHSDVRGCMVIKPYGYAIWENMRDVLDAKFKETGHSNAISRFSSRRATSVKKRHTSMVLQKNVQ